jgi:pimeloyl-ACP methyl ester carboxylesterase
MSRVTAATLRARVAAVLSIDAREDWRRVTVPKLYLRAAADRLIPRSALDTLQALRDDLRIREFDAPHFLLQTRPRECAAEVKTFLAACS